VNGPVGLMMNFATGRTAIMKYLVFIGSIIIAAIALLWSVFLMPTIENSSYICTLYSPEEYQEILSYGDLELADLSSEKTITLDLKIEFPFSIPEDATLFMDVFAMRRSANLYYDSVPSSRKIQVNVPAPAKYPDIYMWSFSLLIPSKSAICTWGLEEEMLFENEDFPRSWRIKLLTYRLEKETGGGRSTIFEPI